MAGRREFAASFVGSAPRRAVGAAAAGAVSGAFLVITALLILRGGGGGGRALADEAGFHLPTIERFAREWPRPDLSDYPSATTPGYHLAITFVRRYVSSDVRVLRFVGCLFTVALLAMVAAYVGRRTGLLTAVAVCLPLACSLYVLSSGAWLLPDNAGWLGVTAVLVLGFRRRVDAWTWAAGGVILLALVLVRQIHLWAAAVPVVAAWLGSEPASPAEYADLRPRLARAAAAAAAALPAVLLLAWFFRLWHGALPPSARGLNAGANPAAPAMVLAVFGAVGVFYCGFLAPRWPDLRRAWRVVATAAAIAAVVAVLPRTDYDPAAGRWSGLWNAAKALPTVAHRSPLVVALATAGGAIVAAWAVALPRRDRWIFLTAFVAFTAAHAMTHEAYQRYYEPFALILFALAAARARRGESAGPRWALAGPLILAMLLAGVSAAALR